jgi:hypothetical protein
MRCWMGQWTRTRVTREPTRHPDAIAGWLDQCRLVPRNAACVHGKSHWIGIQFQSSKKVKERYRSTTTCSQSSHADKGWTSNVLTVTRNDLHCICACLLQLTISERSMYLSVAYMLSVLGLPCRSKIRKHAVGLCRLTSVRSLVPTLQCA